MPDPTPPPEPTPPAPPAKTYTEADVAGLKTKNQELLDKLSATNQRLAVIGDRTSEQVKEDLELATATRTAKAKAEGDFESLKTQLVTQHSSEIEKVTGRTKKVEGKLYDVMARRETEAAIVKAGGNPVILLPHVLPHVKVVEQEDDFLVQVVDAKGKQRIADGQANPMTIDQLVDSFKNNETFGSAFAASSAAGGGARGSGGAPGGAGTVMIPKDATPQEYRRLKGEAEKAGRPYAIAS